jgi:hypothetical protein
VKLEPRAVGRLAVGEDVSEEANREIRGAAQRQRHTGASSCAGPADSAGVAVALSIAIPGAVAVGAAMAGSARGPPLGGSGVEAELRGVGALETGPRSAQATSPAHA